MTLCWLFCVLLSSAVSPPPAPAEVAFESGGTTLAASLFLPAGEGPFPGVVLIHGSGDSDRTNLWAAAFAEGLSRRGVAVLFPDKRGCGKSGGDWKTASFEILADDAAAAVRRFGAEKAVDAGAIGVLGVSQGGHVAPLAAAREARVSFVVSVSSSTVPISEQAADELDKAAERAGFAPNEKAELAELNRRVLAWVRTSAGWDDYRQALEAARRGSWAGKGIAEGYPDTPDHWVWEWARAVGEFDPLPSWRDLRVPGLLVYGARDTQIRVAKSVARLEPILTGSVSRSIDVVIYGDAGHPLYEPDRPELRRAMLDHLAAWIGDRTVRGRSAR